MKSGGFGFGRKALEIRLEMNGRVLCEGTTQELPPETTIGRAADCRWRIPPTDKTASNHHARLYAKRGKWYVEDTGSRNGMYCKGEKVARWCLGPGDQVSIGDCVLVAVRAEAKDGSKSEYHRLEQLNGADAGRMIDLDRESSIIGSAPTCDIVCDDNLVSHRHAALECKRDGSCWVKDLKSRNGTRVNRVQLKAPERMLRDGDILSVAYVDFRFWDKNTTHVPSNIRLRAAVAAMTVLVCLAGWFFWNAAHPSADYLLKRARGQAGKGQFRAAMQLTADARLARHHASYAPQIQARAMEIQNWQNTAMAWNAIQNNLQNRLWIWAQQGFTRVSNWDWNPDTAIVHKRRADCVQRLLDSFLTMRAALEKGNPSATELAAARNAWEKALEDAEREPAMREADWPIAFEAQTGFGNDAKVVSTNTSYRNVWHPLRDAGKAISAEIARGIGEERKMRSAISRLGQDGYLEDMEKAFASIQGVEQACVLRLRRGRQDKNEDVVLVLNVGGKDKDEKYLERLAGKASATNGLFPLHTRLKRVLVTTNSLPDTANSLPAKDRRAKVKSLYEETDPAKDRLVFSELPLPAPTNTAMCFPARTCRDELLVIHGEDRKHKDDQIADQNGPNGKKYKVLRFCPLAENQYNRNSAALEELVAAEAAVASNLETLASMGAKRGGPPPADEGPAGPEAPAEEEPDWDGQLQTELAFPTHTDETAFRDYQATLAAANAALCGRTKKELKNIHMAAFQNMGLSEPTNTPTAIAKLWAPGVLQDAMRFIDWTKKPDRRWGEAEEPIPGCAYDEVLGCLFTHELLKSTEEGVCNYLEKTPGEFKENHEFCPLARQAREEYAKLKAFADFVDASPLLKAAAGLPDPLPDGRPNQLKRYRDRAEQLLRQRDNKLKETVEPFFGWDRGGVAARVMYLVVSPKWNAKLHKEACDIRNELFRNYIQQARVDTDGLVEYLENCIPDGQYFKEWREYEVSHPPKGGLP